MLERISAINRSLIRLETQPESEVIGAHLYRVKQADAQWINCLEGLKTPPITDETMRILKDAQSEILRAYTEKLRSKRSLVLLGIRIPLPPVRLH